MQRRGTKGQRSVYNCSMTGEAIAAPIDSQTLYLTISHGLLAS
jgi:hypothetical protein